MYIFSFLRSMLRPRNILSTLYFLANLGIIFGIFYFLDIPVAPDSDLNSVYSGLIGVGANFVFILIALSPIGEFFWRLTNGISKRPPEELAACWQTAQSAFSEVLAAARKKSRSVSSKVKLYFSSEKYVNAFALGHRTVILTDGMLRLNNRSTFTGVIAHEFGHIAYGDSDLNLGINVCNIFISVFMSIVSILSYILVIALMYKEGRAGCLAMVIRYFFQYIISFIFRAWIILGVICVNATSRKREYAADKFAKDIGYGKELSAFLAGLGDGKIGSKWYSALFQSHPASPDRVKALAAAA